MAVIIPQNPALVRKEKPDGHVWRTPDTVDQAKDGKWMLTKKTADGNLYRLVVLPEPSGGFSFHTFYKEKSVK